MELVYEGCFTKLYATHLEGHIQSHFRMIFPEVLRFATRQNMSYESVYRYEIDIYIYIYIYIYISVTGTEKGLGKETTRFGLSAIFGVFDVDPGGCADKPWQLCCSCAVVFPLKDQSR